MTKPRSYSELEAPIDSAAPPVHSGLRVSETRDVTFELEPVGETGEAGSRTITVTRSDGDPGLRAVLDALPHPAAIYDPDLRYRFANRPACARLQKPLLQIVGRSDRELSPDAACEAFLPLLERARDTRVPVLGEYRIERPASEQQAAQSTELELSCTPVLAADGSLACIVALSRELSTGRRALQEASLFQALLANHGYALVTTDASGQIASFSPGAEHIYGYGASEVIGHPFAMLGAAASKLRLADLLALDQDIELEDRHRRKDGRTIDVSVTASLARNAQGGAAGYAAVIRDSSERKALERRLRGTAQLEALARASAGVAHDIGNALTSIRLYAGLLGAGALSEQQGQDLDAIGVAARRGAALVTQLYSINRARAAQSSVLNLSDAISELFPMLERLLGSSVVFELDVRQAQLPIEADPALIEQIVLSLAMNARDAIKTSGALTIAVSSTELGESKARELAIRPGTYGVISVKDTGTGIEPSLASRIFEPFFSTKPNAAGLGLLVVREALRQLNGAVDFSSQPGHGSEFIVYIPLLSRPLARPSQAPQDPVEKTGKSVLLIDDDVPVRGAARRVLNASGYRVLEAEDGSEAARIAADHNGPIDVLVCSTASANVRGGIDAVRASRPAARVLVASSDPEAHAKLIAEVASGYLRKPYSPEALVAALALCLEQDAPASAKSDQPVVLVVDSDEELRDSLLRVLAECELTALGAKSGLHAIQELQRRHVDVIVTEHFMAGMDGVSLLDAVRTRWPHVMRVLFTLSAAPDVIVDAVNRAGAHRVLLKNMHAVQIRDEIERIALDVRRRRGPA